MEVEPLNLMNISNLLTFRVETFQLALSIKSQLKVNSSGPKRFDSTDNTLQWRSSPLCILIGHLINTVQFSGTEKLSLLSVRKSTFKF